MSVATPTPGAKIGVWMDNQMLDPHTKFQHKRRSA